MKKRLLAMLLCVAMVASLLTVGAAAEEGNQIFSGQWGNDSNITWMLDTTTGVLIFTGMGDIEDIYPNEAPYEEYKDKITTVVISDGISSVSNDVFPVFNSIKSIVLGKDVSQIGYYSDYNEVTHPDPEYDELYYGEFRKYGYFDPTIITNCCQNLSSITVDLYNERYVSYDGVLYEKMQDNKLKLLIYPRGKAELEYTVQPGTVAIMGTAFSYNENITKVTLPAGLKSIYPDAFMYCKSLSEISLPEGVEFIAGSAFWYTKLSQLHIPASVDVCLGRIIGDEASNLDDMPDLSVYFYGNAPAFDGSLLTTRVDGSRMNVTESDEYLFEDVHTTVYYPQNASGWTDTIEDFYNNYWELDLMPEGYEIRERVEFVPWDPKQFPGAPATPLELISTYPANGEVVDISANELALTFNRDLDINPNWLNGSIYIKDYETDEVVKEFDDIQYLSNGGHISGSTMTIRYGLVGLDVGKTYYIEIDPNVILGEQWIDGNWDYFDGLEKGEWTFSISEESTFKFLASEGNKDLEYTYNYTDDYFNVNSYYYNHDLAKTSLALSLSAFNSCIAPNANYDKTDAARNVIAMLGDMGFEDINVDSYEEKPTANSIAQAIGHKSIIIDGMDYTLLTIAVRGGGYEAEWFNNFKVGSDSQHVGFNDSANSVIESIEEYIEDELTAAERSNIKIWLTGFGRGAAVANVAGHKINTLAGDSGSIFANVATGNVYVYTFATPMAAAGEQASPKEENIYNIINPVDLITKLTPSVWGFYRYGTTYSLPSQEMDSKLFEAVRDDAINISAELTGKITTIALTWQGSALDSIVNAMSIMEPDSIPSNALQYALGKYFEDKYSSAPGEIGVFGTIKEIWNLVSTVIDVVTLDFTSLAKTYLLKPAVVEGGSETLDQALSYIEMAHYPETYLAWMYALDAKEFGHGIYRKDYINCPVDVTVYDENGNNVAGFKDEEPYFEADGYVTAYVDENEQKVLVFPNDREYRVEITPYDSGTLSYTVEEYSAADNETRRVVSYQSIPIEVGDKFEGVVSAITDTESETIYTFSKNEDGELEPTVDQSGNEVEKLTVNVSVTGNGQANGGGTFLNGEYALLTATPNSGSSFTGWYVDGNLLSTETELRILVDDDKYVTAVFTSGGNIPAVDVPSNQPEEPEEPTDSLPFTDVSVGDWFYDYVAYVYTNDLMDGVSDTGFNPNSTMTRAMVWAILARIDGQTVTGESWIETARAWAMSEGVSDGENANGLVTREQFATMLWRYAGEPASDYSLSAYTDASGVSDWAQTAMCWAVENGIITGVTATTIVPQGTATRAQCATMLMRFIESVA